MRPKHFTIFKALATRCRTGSPMLPPTFIAKRPDDVAGRVFSHPSLPDELRLYWTRRLLEGRDTDLT